MLGLVVYQDLYPIHVNSIPEWKGDVFKLCGVKKGPREAEITLSKDSFIFFFISAHFQASLFRAKVLNYFLVFIQVLDTAEKNETAILYIFIAAQIILPTIVTFRK